MDLQKHLKQTCQQSKKILALPEADDPRILKAAFILAHKDVVEKILLPGDKEAIVQLAEDEGVDLISLESKIEIIERNELPVLQQAGSWLYEGRADAVVAGVKHPTADVIRSGIMAVGLAKGVRTVSGAFIMHKPNRDTLLYADCGVVIAPTIPQLVDIAWESVQTFKAVLPHQTPKVAFLSYSTMGSAQHETAEKMAAACEAFKQRCPDVIAEGELQFDAAVVPEICAQKAPDSALHGDANCLIFPDLGAGNIAYKITQRLAGYEAYGPLLQGLSKPFYDLSRGSTVEDIVSTAMIAMVRSGHF